MKNLTTSTKTLTSIILLAVTAVSLVAALLFGAQRPVNAAGNFTVNPIFSSYMVLQRDKLVPVFGTGVNGTNITVAFNGQAKTGTVTGGKFSINLDPMSANATSQTMTVSDGVTTVTYTDVLVGEVWLIAGQSNVLVNADNDTQWSSVYKADTINHGNIRIRHRAWSAWARADTNSRTTGTSSAVGYFFAHYINHQLNNIPIGVWQRGVGGTEVGEWTHANGNPGTLYDSEIKPDQPFAIRGVIWYQGENENTDAYAAAYYSNLTGLLAEWRSDWGNLTMPFAIMQIHYNGDMEFAAVTRATQLNVHLNDPNTCIAVTADFPAGGSGGWHPPYKSTPSERLARHALYVFYGRTDLYPPTGPIADEATSYAIGNQITVNFRYAETGLTTGLFMSAPGAPGPIKVAGTDGIYYDATAQIVGSSLVVSSASVPNPVSVAYVWSYGSGNLYSNAQLPVFPFKFTVGGAPQPTNTPAAPTPTPTNTSVPPTATSTPTVGPSPTPTNTSFPPTSTFTPTSTNTPGGSASIFFDGFEDGSMSDWSPTNNAQIKTSPVYAGSYSAGAKLTGVFYRTISTAGYTNIHVKYAGQTSNLDAGEYLKIEWYDGSTWTVLDQLLSEGTWTLRDWTMPAGAANNPNFALRFSTNAGGNTEWVYVDNIEVTSQ